MEAGAGTLLRMRPGVADVVLIVADPSAKSIEVAQRLAQIAATRARVIVVANQIRGPEDAHVLREAFGDHELVEIPYEPSIVHAERRGLAPIDIDRDCSGVAALRSLAERLATPQPT